MPKNKYLRHFRTEWTTQQWAKGWLREYKTIQNYDEADSNEAYCLYCHCSLRAHYSDLQKHALTKQHKNNAKNRVIPKKQTVQHYFPPKLLSNDQKKIELKLTMFVLQHCSFRSVDHLGELLINNSGQGNFSNLRLHYTKCSLLVQHVFGPAYLKNIVNSVGDKKYSCIIDESTDVSVHKYLAICIRYFDGTNITTDFLGLIEVERATADDLYAGIVTFFKKVGIPLENMIALGTDGGSNLCGSNHSVYTLLKSNNSPNLLLVKCICHAIHLCVSKASGELPTCLDFLAHEVYNWFSNSPLRRLEYQKIFNLININENRNFKHFIKLSGTRWLSRYNVIRRILDNWIELKLFFEMAGTKEKCYKAKTIYNILCDNKMLMYFKFIMPFLEETNRLNLMFQSNNYDINSLYKHYFLLIESLAMRVIKPLFLNKDIEQNIRCNHNNNEEENENKILVLKNIIKAVENSLAFLSVDDADLGYSFNVELNQQAFSEVEKTEIKSRCLKFIVTLLKEFVSRVPSNIKIFDKVKFLNPQVCLSKTMNIDFSALGLEIFIYGEDIYSLNNEWRKLKLINWGDEFKTGGVPNNVLQFWPVVLNYVDGSGEKPFEKLATVVLRLLCLPVSNAAVERVFSIMNLVKTKVRNRMKFTTLESIIRTRIFCFNRKICCKNFQVTAEMLNLFSSDIYNKHKVDESMPVDPEEFNEILDIVSVASNRFD